MPIPAQTYVNEQLPWWGISLCFTFESGRLASPGDLKHKKLPFNIVVFIDMANFIQPCKDRPRLSNYGWSVPHTQRQTSPASTHCVGHLHMLVYHLGCVNVRVFKSVVILARAGSFGVCDSDTWQVTIEPSASRFRCSSFRLLPSSSSTFLPSIVHT